MMDDLQLYDLVVVGCSAGGIEALSLFVGTLPSEFPAPLVLAQHLDPDGPSHLAEILARRSTLPVRRVEEGAPEALEPGVVYVVPADRDVDICDHTVGLRERAHGHPKPSVDLLLTRTARGHDVYNSWQEGFAIRDLAHKQHAVPSQHLAQAVGKMRGDVRRHYERDWKVRGAATRRPSRVPRCSRLTSQ